MWSGYKVEAFMEALPFLLLLLAFSTAYFLLSRNNKWLTRLLVSSHCLIFILGNIFSVVGSDYYVRGHWENGELIHTSIGKLLNNALLGIFACGLIAVLYSFWKFEGNKYVHLLSIPILIVAFLVLFISGMTLTKDWI